MSILTDGQIIAAREQGDIVITPFERANLGTNSYDVRLANKLVVYKSEVLDVRQNNPTTEIHIPEDGIILQPGELYLGSTVEYTETHNYVPMLDGRSSIGRFGIDIHATAGVGDAGFCGHWTLEISVTRPVRVYANIRIGQLLYYQTVGKVIIPYNRKPGAKYNGQVRPTPSRYYRDVERDLTNEET